MKNRVKLSRLFESSTKGTFLSATTATAFAALFATALYINDNYSNAFTIFSKYYLSIRGFAFGIVIPIFVGVMTAGLVLVLNKAKNLAARKVFKFTLFAILCIAYIPITFIGALAVLYLAG